MVSQFCKCNCNYPSLLRNVCCHISLWIFASFWEEHFLQTKCDLQINILSLKCLRYMARTSRSKTLKPQFIRRIFILLHDIFPNHFSNCSASSSVYSRYIHYKDKLVHFFPSQYNLYGMMSASKYLYLDF